MTYDEIKNLLVENFCKGGTYDNSGRWRYSSEGNTVYLADKKGGWAYVCKKIENNGYMYIVKYSIKADGGMKNCGKYSQAWYTDIKKMLDKATKYAIQEPWAEINEPLHWINIEKEKDITQQLMTIICARAKKQFRL